jgi:hypothetical protein
MSVEYRDRQGAALVAAGFSATNDPWDYVCVVADGERIDARIWTGEVVLRAYVAGEQIHEAEGGTADDALFDLADRLQRGIDARTRLLAVARGV